jgi:hypothetical protein
MAFQTSPTFFPALQVFAGSAVLSESEPARNFILDERVPHDREADYLAHPFVPVAAMTADDWFQHGWQFARERLCQPASRISQTFEPVNQQNWLNGIRPDWDVVRIETLDGLNSRGTDAGLGESRVADLLRRLIEAREASTPLDLNDELLLSGWLEKVNLRSDRRPAFVAPFAEVEPLLAQPEWADRLRDAFGLAHVQPRGGRPRLVVLMQYSLDRVFQTHRSRPAWAASPTVLDDVPSTGPNPCFFPAPRSSSSDGFGFTIDLRPPGDFWQELLHAPIAYQLDDIRRVGEVTAVVSDDDIAAARARHRDLLSDDLTFLSDLPS